MAALRPSDGLLEQVAAYTAEAVSAVTLEGLSAPTPCTQWNLLDLMMHLNTSLGVIIETLEHGHPGLDDGLRHPAGRGSYAAGLLDADVGSLLATAVRFRTERLVRIHAALRQGGGSDIVLVGGRPLLGDMVAATGAVEIAVHSWDIATACGRTLPIPDSPAGELLDLSGLIVDGAGWPGLFASPVTAPATAGPGDRLIALLGRTPL